MVSLGPTPSWLESVDAVYKLFEDPALKSQYPDLAAKVEQSVRLSEQVFRDVGLDHCALSFNGGKDCTVIVHILAAVLRRLAGLSHPSGNATNEQGASTLSNSTLAASSSSSSSTILPTSSTSSSPLVSLASVYITCPSPFPVLESFVRASQSRYNLDLVTVPGDMKRGLVEYLEGGGQPGVPHVQARKEREANGVQEDTSQSRPRDIRAIFIGTRRTDPTGETLQPRKWTDPSWPPLERIHLILDWDYADVWAFLRCPALGEPQRGDDEVAVESGQQASSLLDEDREQGYGTTGGGTQGVPYCTLYDQGYTSLGSTFNTFPNPLLKRQDGSYREASELTDGSSERAGRGSKKP